MKVILVVSVLMAALMLANGVPLPQQQQNTGGDPHGVVIVKQTFDNIGDGTYSHETETSDGTHIQAQGSLEDAGTEGESQVVNGSFSYIGLDGLTYLVNYIADKNGYQPDGVHIPRH